MQENQQRSEGTTQRTREVGMKGLSEETLGKIWDREDGR